MLKKDKKKQIFAGFLVQQEEIIINSKNKPYSPWANINL